MLAWGRVYRTGFGGQLLFAGTSAVFLLSSLMIFPLLDKPLTV